MNILFLMAGSSDKFIDSGFQYPKNLVEIDGTPMVERVIDCFSKIFTKKTHTIFAIGREEDRKYHTGSVINLLLPDAHIVKVPETTAGAACTALLTIDKINNDNPLLIINGDIICEFNMKKVLKDFKGRKLDGGIVVFKGVHPRWSYVRCNKKGLVLEAAEKNPISNQATVGVYYFAKGKYFVDATMNMIKKDAQVDGKFYVCPTYNEMILQQKQIGVHQVEKDSYFSQATPHGVAAYETHLKSRQAQT